MSALGKVTVRSLAAHKVRMLLTVVSVLLGTAFVAGSFIFTDTLKGTFNAIVDSGFQGVDSRVQPKHDYDPGVPLALLDTVRKVPGVAAAQPEYSSPVVVVDSHGKRLSSGGAPSQGGAWFEDTIGERPRLVSGRVPRAAGEVVVNDTAASKGKLRLGDQLKIVLPNSAVVPVRLVGIWSLPTATGGFIGALFTPTEATRLLTDGAHVGAIDVAAVPGVSEKELTARLAAALPDAVDVKTGADVRASIQHEITTALSFMNYILLGFGIVALIVGTFIIYNTFSMIIAQRLKELALLRAIGASRSQIRRSVLTEAAVIGTIGSALGLAAGVGLAFGLRRLLDVLDVGLPAGDLVLSVRTAVVAMSLGVSVTLVSAYAPARRAGRIPPLAAMRVQHASVDPTDLHRRSLLGVVFLLGGGTATVFGATVTGTGTATSLTGIGLVLVTSGLMLLSPVIAGWVITPLGRLVGRPFGAAGRLARTNAVRNPRRTAATAFALTLGLVLVSGMAVIGASMKTSVNALFDSAVRADFILSTQTQVSVPLPAAAAAGAVPGVGSFVEVHLFSAALNGKHSFGSGVDGRAETVMAMEMVSGSSTITADGILVSDKVAAARGWKVGSPVAVSEPGRSPHRLTVTGVYVENQLLGPWLVSGDVYREMIPRNQWSDVVALVKAAPGADLAALRRGLEAATNDYYVVQVQDPEENKGQVASQVNGLLGLVYGLLGLAIVIAILGIVNTLALSVIERRREIGMLRAVGMQRKQVRRTIYLESFLIAVFGALLGLGLGLAYGSLFTRALRDQGLDHLTVPWGQAVTFLVLAAAVGVLAALWPGIRAARTPALEAIAEA